MTGFPTPNKMFRSVARIGDNTLSSLDRARFGMTEASRTTERYMLRAVVVIAVCMLLLIVLVAALF